MMSINIILLSRDEGSARQYLEDYKAFRLLALRTAPTAFGSSYEKEVAYTDDVWVSRLKDPKATTFLAIQSGRIVCTISAMGPLPCSPEDSSPSRDPWLPVEKSSSQNSDQLHFRFIRMFTHPEARGRGIAKGIVKKAIEHGLKEAAKIHSTYAASIVVDADNSGARALYEKCGFVEIGREAMPGTTRLVILLKWEQGSGTGVLEAAVA